VTRGEYHSAVHLHRALLDAADEQGPEIERPPDIRRLLAPLAALFERVGEEEQPVPRRMAPAFVTRSTRT